MVRRLAGTHAAPQVLPWYRRTYRWGQTNITEQDPAAYDIEWWRGYWRRTRVQGVIVNAGGIVAYYPSKYPAHHRAEQLGDRDLFGALAEAARKEGLVLVARMDSNRAHDVLYRQHPDWFAVDAQGKPYRAADLYVTCVNGPYYGEYLPQILLEIIERYHPDGFTDNSWSGLDRDSICHCVHCARRFRDWAGAGLPARKDWRDPVYRRWIEWNTQRRVELWELNNRVTRGAGGPDCVWSGMLSGDLASEGRRFRDLKALCERAEIVFFDDQGRSNASGFQGNGDLGKRMHGLLGWDKLVPESMAMYQRAPTFRKAAGPEHEARLWMLEGIAGGIQPWWHHVGALQEDLRQFRTAEPVFRWHEKNERYLVNRRPVATVGVAWSQRNVDFFGGDEPEGRVLLPYRGMSQALVRARIPYLPVHMDHFERDVEGLALVVLPNLAVMTERHAEALRRFVARGGGLLATGDSSLWLESGERREDFALADVFGAHATAERLGPATGTAPDHSYLRLLPDMDATGRGPRRPEGASPQGARHPVLRGFEETNLIPFGGVLRKVAAAGDTTAPLTYVPDFPAYPPETSWMREPRTSIPGLLVRSVPGGGRVAYLAADIDARFARENLPDHFRLLSNVVRWAASDNLPLRVTGPGFVDCHLYARPGGFVLHLINLTNAAAWRAPVDELLPVGPLQVSVRLGQGPAPRRAVSLVSESSRAPRLEQGWTTFEVAEVRDHEVIVLE